MKKRTLGLLIAVLTSFIFVVSSTELLTESTSAQKQNNQAKLEKTVIPKSKRIKKIIKGAEKPGEIPDDVAYELFLRTVAEGNARGLVKRAGFNDETVEIIMSEAYSLNESLQALDRRVFELKSSKEKPTNAQLGSELSKLETKKDELVEKRINSFLPQSLGGEKMNKLRNFIQSNVKRKIQKILVNEMPKSGDLALSKYLTNSFTKKAVDGGGQLYLYSDAWQGEMNVFGSGTLSEQYSSNTSYRVTVSVTSPTGRSNTTVSDWNYATLIHDSGLSVGVEDGVYSIRADFEEQYGYYDEYGNFFGTGSSFVGSSSDSVQVAPTIVMSSATVTPNLFFLSGNLSGGNGTGTVSARITATQSVPDDTTVEFDFYETINDSSVAYTVQAGTSNGYPPHPSTNRRLRRKITNSGNIETLGEMFTITLTPTSANTGTVTNQLRINRICATANCQNGGVQGENSQVPAVFTLATPPPTLSPTPPEEGGDCLSGFTTSGEKYSKDKDSGSNTSNLCSPCNPDPVEVFMCQQGGGVYDWSTCFCGQSPIVLDILGNGFSLTNSQNGVLFDITADGVKERMAWTSPNTDDTWLALDRNQNNSIDDGKELFGNISEQPAGQNPRQGFASLGMFDTTARGGNGDGQITRSDAVFRKLRLWRDANQNGISEPEEPFRLHAFDVIAVSLDYKESNRRDEFGNRFKYRAKIRDRANANVGRLA